MALRGVSRDDLPATGNDLRRTYKSVATSVCGVPDDVSAFVMGHMPEGMSQKYLLRWALSSGDAIKKRKLRSARPWCGCCTVPQKRNEPRMRLFAEPSPAQRDGSKRILALAWPNPTPRVAAPI